MKKSLDAVRVTIAIVETGATCPNDLDVKLEIICAHEC
jgi:hypothetical protein